VCGMAWNKQTVDVLLLPTLAKSLRSVGMFHECLSSNRSRLSVGLVGVGAFGLEFHVVPGFGFPVLLGLGSGRGGLLLAFLGRYGG
jgi:hypothetical protein